MEMGIEMRWKLVVVGGSWWLVYDPAFNECVLQMYGLRELVTLFSIDVKRKFDQNIEGCCNKSNKLWDSNIGSHVIQLLRGDQCPRYPEISMGELNEAF